MLEPKGGEKLRRLHSREDRFQIRRGTLGTRRPARGAELRPGEGRETHDFAETAWIGWTEGAGAECAEETDAVNDASSVLWIDGWHRDGAAPSQHDAATTEAPDARSVPIPVMPQQGSVDQTNDMARAAIRAVARDVLRICI